MVDLNLVTRGIPMSPDLGRVKMGEDFIQKIRKTEQKSNRLGRCMNRNEARKKDMSS